MGLSKLDYLLKISVFQKYKDKKLQKAKDEVIEEFMKSDVDYDEEVFGQQLENKI